MQEQIPHWLTKQAYLAPEKIAIELADDQQWTFLELKEKSESFAKKLATLGVSKTNKVAILSTNRLEMVIALHALSFLGAICVMLNTRLTKKELTEQMEQADVSFLLTTDDLQTEKKLTFPHLYTFTEVERVAEKNIQLQTVLNLHDPFTMMFTSGTTGRPKGVVHTYGNHWWSAIGSVLNLGLENEDKWLATLPIFHVGGLSIFLRSVIYGIPVYLMESYDREQLYHAMTEKNITIVSLVTVMLQQLVEDLATRPLPETLRSVLLGGGSVPEPLLNKVKKLKIPLFQSYGMTETSSQIVTLSPEDAIRKLGSAGKPLFPAELKILKTQDEQVGEIMVKGPMVISGYYNHPKANEQSFTDGWLKTGDLGYLDEEGFLYVVDRRTDLIISGGENIYPSEIENVLLDMNGVKEVGVVGKKDDTWGQVPVAFIVRHTENLSKEEIIEHAQQSLARYKVPKEIYFIDTLPRNASNKLMRHVLIESINN